MTKRELHHHPDPCPPAPCPPPRPCIACWVTFIFLTISVAISPIIIFISIQIWYNAPKPPPPYVLDEIYACADLGPLHGRGLPNDRRGRTGYTGPHPGLASAVPGGPNAGRPGPPPNPRLPGIDPSSELCRAVKAIVDQSIDHDAIAERAAEITCEECIDDERWPRPDYPLVRGNVEIKLYEKLGDPNRTQIQEDENCPGIEWIEIASPSGTNNTGKRDVTIFRPSDIDLPNFCKDGNPKENRNPEWELLEQPRVYHARTWFEGHDPKSEEDPELIGGPYAVFIAKHIDGLCCEVDKRGNKEAIAVRDKMRVTVFIVYIDYITNEPNIIELNIEVESGKPIVGVEDTIQLVSNVKLNSLDKQVTFQIGQGARRIVVAGYDFNAESTTSDRGPRRRSEEDTSGSYVVKLDDTGAVKDVCRVDLGSSGFPGVCL